MADRVAHPQRMVELVEALGQDGFSRDEIAESYAVTVAPKDGDAQVPYARETCTNCADLLVSRLQCGSPSPWRSGERCLGLAAALGALLTGVLPSGRLYEPSVLDQRFQTAVRRG